MNKAIKKRWLNALRSDAYRQGTDALRFGNTFCCLGVLCDLHATVMYSQWEYDETTGLFSYFGETILLPKLVCEWAGLPEQNPQALKVGLTAHNDGRRRSFKQLARLVDTHL